MSVSPFKERFSLAWLAPSDAPAVANSAYSSSRPAAASAIPVNPLPLGMEAALDLIGNQVLAKLAAMPGQTSNLLNLASASSMRFDALLPVVQHLASKGFIERMVEDPSGNDTYKATQANLGQQWAWLAASYAPAVINPPSFSPQPAPTPGTPIGPLPTGVEAVFNSIGSQVLANLTAVPGQASSLLNLASASSMRFEALLPVVQYLASKGLVERVREDPSGNDTYKIAQGGVNPQAIFSTPS